jgi:putative transposase
MRSNPERLTKRQRLRLVRSAYAIAGQPILVTICTRDRRPILAGEPIARVVNKALRAAAVTVPNDLLVWCVMPDHLHVVLAPRAGADAVSWVRLFKGQVASSARQSGIQKLWQRGFHDRVVRSEESVASVVRYVLGNPVRAGLARTWREWPHHGSTVWDLSAWTDE